MILQALHARADHNAEYFMANYRMSRTLGVGSFGKVSRQTLELLLHKFFFVAFGTSCKCRSMQLSHLFVNLIWRKSLNNAKQVALIIQLDSKMCSSWHIVLITMSLIISVSFESNHLMGIEEMQCLVIFTCKQYSDDTFFYCRSK